MHRNNHSQWGLGELQCSLSTTRTTYLAGVTDKVVLTTIIET